MKKRSESTLVTEVMRYLQCLENSGNIAFYNRQQAGSLPIQRGNKWSRIRLGREGVSDIWAIPIMSKLFIVFPIIWIECKSDAGAQSEAQKEFQKTVESCGHYYWIIKSCDELEKKFKEIGIL